MTSETVGLQGRPVWRWRWVVAIAAIRFGLGLLSLTALGDNPGPPQIGPYHPTAISQAADAVMPFVSIVFMMPLVGLYGFEVDTMPKLFMLVVLDGLLWGIAIYGLYYLVRWFRWRRSS